MCRITAAISNRPASGRDLLYGNPKSLLAQAGAVKGRFQDDGWGIGFYRGPVPAVVKSPGPARLEKPAFEAAADTAVSRVTVAHLRDASNPAGLPKARLISRNCTQPFSADGLVFAHNGTLFIKDEIRALLGKYASKVKGANDSEVLFWQVVKMLDAYGSPEAALAMALDEIRTVWTSCRDKYPGRRAPYRGLNIFLASADSLTVLCHYQLKNEGGKDALLTPGWEFGRVAWRREKDRVVFSSEPADAGPGWKKMNDPEIARAEARGGKILLSFKALPVP
ncbi:MAG: class II glutamine amidotransferase [Elusimicrobiota bacterium]|nr:class II glutamine amidotransferase [Elusimicrobiota bacterium]